MQKYVSLLSFSKSIGMSSAEYALIIGLVVIVSIPALLTQGNTVQNQLENQTQQISQMDQMTRLLQAPQRTLVNNSNDRPIDVSGPMGTECAVPGNCLSTMAEQFAISENQDGTITVVGAGTNTTSLEGTSDTISQTLANQMETMAQNSENQAKADQINALARRAKKLAQLQDDLKKSPSRELYNTLLEEARVFQTDAQKLTDNSTLTNLNSIVLNIAKKNYLDPARAEIRKQSPFRLLRPNRKVETVETLKLDTTFKIKKFSKQANSATTRETAQKIETTPRASLEVPNTLNTSRR